MVEKSDNQCYKTKKDVRTYKLNHDGLICQFCGKECKNRNSLCNHERLCKLNPNRQLTKYEKYGPIQNFNADGKVTWNKGLTKDTDERVAKGALSLKNGYSSGRIGKKFGDDNVSSSPEVKQKISTKMKEIYSICPPNVAGRSKCGTYRGIYCRSSWELAFVIYNLEHGINFIANKNLESIFGMVNTTHTFQIFIIQILMYMLK